MESAGSRSAVRGTVSEAAKLTCSSLRAVGAVVTLAELTGALCVGLGVRCSSSQLQPPASHVAASTRPSRRGPLLTSGSWINLRIRRRC